MLGFAASAILGFSSAMAKKTFQASPHAVLISDSHNGFMSDNRSLL